ncbi:MAG: LysM peptidoglycan-binding domain-containing protein [Clostridia bacterium]|nr:LysM peptidoglycan-binding domain-containing protein [Clostridia bacterium]MDD4027315.1 LysM peptidoglycan-binding domain-containing protein [Candidatus Shapirobacteria bacterium]
MSNYAIFFDYDNRTYRLPVNPEQIETSSVQAIEKYEILKLGQIAIPTHMELKEYSFESEFPHERLHYTETGNQFKGADYYINLFQRWREAKEPVRFIASNGIGDDINSLVLIEELSVTEKAGEEGDKYVSFKLIEYKSYGKKSAVVVDSTPTTRATITKAATATLATKKEEAKVTTNPKSTGTYIVQSGDTLWAIAKKYYGDGEQYIKIYKANKDKIKNPSLVYAGQKLVVPA